MIQNAIFGASLLLFCGGYGQLSQERLLAQSAASRDSAVSEPAIRSLRAMGQKGVDELYQIYLYTFASKHVETPEETNTRTAWRQRVEKALDAVGMQKDNHVSRLYWHIDLEEAKSSAAASGRPILSLRLLGRLDEELSCANSRFFRTALYADPEISKFLRENFVLHWQSVRPVPKVTIDFGDGRKLERTLTGNSIHYLLAPDGTIVDALPGLYGPKAFLERLHQGKETSAQYAEAAKSDATQAYFGFLRKNQEETLRGITEAWESDLSRVGEVFPPVTLTFEKAPTAIAAGQITAEKSLVEMPILREISPRKIEDLRSATSDDIWLRIAALHAEDAKLSEPSRQMMLSKSPAELAQASTMTKLRVEDPLLRTIRNFEESMAVDTVKNEYLFRTQILRWLADANYGAIPVDSLNERVYAELFLTPSSDPWLGLNPPDVYCAIENGGVVK